MRMLAGLDRSSCTNRLLRLCCVRFLNALGVKLDRAQGLVITRGWQSICEIYRKGEGGSSDSSSVFEVQARGPESGRSKGRQTHHVTPRHASLGSARDATSRGTVAEARGVARPDLVSDCAPRQAGRAEDRATGCNVFLGSRTRARLSRGGGPREC